MRVRVAPIVGALLLWFAPGASAQYLGSGSCGGAECHTKRELTWWSREEKGGKEHKNSLAIFERAADKSKRYAETVKLADFMDPKGMCMQCHGTPQLIGGEREGVGCEGCHNPATKYKPFHANNSKPEHYRQSVSMGMADLKGNTKAWVKVCTDCHVLDGKPQYDALTGDGHPDGRRWNVGAKYAGVSKHWKPETAALYTAEKVIARASIDRGGGGPAPVGPEKPPPVGPEKPPPVGPEKPPPVGPEKPPPVGPAKPPPVGPVKPPPAGPVKPATVGPVVPPPVAPAVPAPVDPDPRPRGNVSPLSLPAPPPTTASEILAALQSRVAGYLTRLLRDGVTPAQPLNPLPAPARIASPDAELLQLQAEALALAVEALNLRVKPAPKPPDK